MVGSVSLLCDKEVLFFDEPTSGLDYINMLRVAKMINQLKNKGKIVVVITHDIEFLNLVATKIYDMDNVNAMCRRG